MARRQRHQKQSAPNRGPDHLVVAPLAIAASSKSSTDLLEWLERTYYSTLTSQLGINITYLNQINTWSLTLLTIAVGYILARAPFPDKISLILCIVLWNLGVHLATRAGKAYVNVMRFTVIERDFQAYIFGQRTREAAGPLLESIKTYHWRWASPVSRGIVLKKLLFELGFLYVLGSILALWSYAAWVQYPSRWVIWASGIAFTISAFDLYFNLLHSAFLSTVVVHDRARSLR